MVMDPQTELPSPQQVANVEEGLVSLRAPLPASRTRALARAFFRAIVTEDMPTLASLLMPEASFSSPSSAPKARVLDVFRARTQRFDYRPLAEANLYDDARVETYRFEDFEEGLSLPFARPSAMKPSDIVLRVPISQSETSAGKLFGDEVVFVIGRDGRETRIRAVMEDFLGW